MEVAGAGRVGVVSTIGVVLNKSWRSKVVVVVGKRGVKSMVGVGGGRGGRKLSVVEKKVLSKVEETTQDSDPSFQGRDPCPHSKGSPQSKLKGTLGNSNEKSNSIECETMGTSRGEGGGQMSSNAETSLENDLKDQGSGAKDDIFQKGEVYGGGRGGGIGGGWRRKRK